VALAILLSIAPVLAYVHVYHVVRPRLADGLALHAMILDGTALSPYRYRILVPRIAEVVIRLLGTAFSRENAFLATYAMFDLAALAFLLTVLFRYARLWFTADQALVGVLFVAGTMPVALRDHFFQPWSLLEPGLLTAALLAIHRERIAWVALLTAVATLNRETAVLIPLAFLFTRTNPMRIAKAEPAGRGRPLLVFGACLAIWAAGFVGLRVILGGAAPVETVASLWVQNTTTRQVYTVVNVTLMFGVFWILAAAGWRHAPEFVRRSARIAPLYLLTVLIWGLWFEARLLMVLYPIVVPLALSFLYRGQARSSPA
jgi:hypothetical protein